MAGPAGRRAEAAARVIQARPDRREMPPQVAGLQSEPERPKCALPSRNLRRRGAPHLVCQLRRVPAAHGQSGLPACETAVARQGMHGSAAVLDVRPCRGPEPLREPRDAGAEFILGGDDHFCGG